MLERKLICDFSGTFNYAREPIIRRMEDGAIVCLFLSGGDTEPANNNVVLVSRSEDDGESWSMPRVLFSHNRRGVWCTELFCEDGACFAVVHTYNADCHYRELQTYFAFTRDGGRTWEEPVSPPSGLNGVTLRQGFVMSSGEWFFPLYWQETTYDFDWTKNTSKQEGRGARFPFRCGAAISSDKGKTFSRHGYLTEEFNLWEPNAVELEDGHIMMLMRSGGPNFLFRSDSYDYGRIWSIPEQTDIINPGTKVTLLKIDGKVVMINNFSEEKGWRNRAKLEIWVSPDNCKTWAKKLPLTDPAEKAFYPHAFADEKKRALYVAYENAVSHYITKIPYSLLFN